MKLKRFVLIALFGVFCLVFTSCQDEEVSPSNDRLQGTEGVKEGHSQGPEDD